MTIGFREHTDTRGFSVVEVIIGIVMLSVVLMSLAGAAGLSLQTTSRGRADLDLWAAVQTKADSLIGLGWGNVVSGADTVQGYPMSWTVSGTDLERIDLVVDRSSWSGRQAVQDTIVLYFTN